MASSLNITNNQFKNSIQSKTQMASSLNIPLLQLNTGMKIPVLGFGTATFSSSKSDEIQALLQAIEHGYRHFDTASVYGTEDSLGEAIAEALHRGLIQTREELFITSKLWCTDAHAELVLPALQKTLKNLKLEYLDLYLVHWPVSAKLGGPNKYPLKKENVVPFDCKSVWAAMEECKRLGLAKSIGVSNFTYKKIDDLLAFSNITPAVNQVELNPCWQQKKLINLCKEKGILVTSFSPLGAVGTSWGSNRVVDNEILKGIAKAKGKSVPQVCLRWAYEQGVAIVVKSYKPERMKENRDIFDWELSDEESKKIGEIPQSRGQKGEEFISESGPIKSFEELWDGDL